MAYINLSGVFKATDAAPLALTPGSAGAITSLIVGMKWLANNNHHTAGKQGAMEIMRALSSELGRHSIRVNYVNPPNVDTRCCLTTRSTGCSARLGGARRGDVEASMKEMRPGPGLGGVR